MFKTKQCAKCKTGALSYQSDKHSPACYYLASYKKKRCPYFEKIKKDKKATFFGWFAGKGSK